MSEKNVKKRNWAFCLYLDSAPADWREQIQLSGIQAAISPLHDKDINPDGTTKKPHHHIILVYGNPTTYNNVKAFTCGELKQTIPQPLQQIIGYYRYLTHKDNPEKYQYSESEIVRVNGFNIRDFVEMTKSEVIKYKREITGFIMDNGITEYGDLMKYLFDGGEDTADWFDVASSNTVYFEALIRSFRYIANGRRDDLPPGR